MQKLFLTKFKKAQNLLVFQIILKFIKLLLKKLANGLCHKVLLKKMVKKAEV